MVQSDNVVPDLGSWRAAELAETARVFAGIGADSNLPDAVRFLSNIAKIIRRRAAQPSASSDPVEPAIFLLSTSPPAAVAVQRVHMLSNGVDPLNGRLWFVSPAVNAGNFVDLFGSDDQYRFRFVTGTAGHGSTVAAVFDPRPSTPQIRFYPNGLQADDVCAIFEAQGEAVTPDGIFDAIQKTYTGSLITPDAQSSEGKLWVNEGRWWPSARAELRIQLYLKAGLQTRFLTCDIREEQPTPAGRFDLEITERDPSDGRVTPHAVLELKVLRSFGETGRPYTAGETLEWVRSGVLQAHAYRLEKGLHSSALCCFDMRDADNGEECFDHVTEDAARLEVALRRWYLYASSELYREALAR